MLGVHAHAATGQLAVTEEECRDVLFATTDESLWHDLVQRQGWPDERYSAWLAHLWQAMLLDPTAEPAGPADAEDGRGGDDGRAATTTAN